MLLGTLVLKIISFIAACAFAHQSYLAFRAACTKTQSIPKVTSMRLGGIARDLVNLAISLLCPFYLVER